MDIKKPSVIKSLVYHTLLIIVFIIIMAVWLPISCQASPGFTACCDEVFPDLYYQSPCLQGNAVKELQESLALLGFYTEAASGCYDDNTVEAVRLFQKENGLAPDGAVKYHVWLKLAQMVENMAAPQRLPPAQGDITVIIDTIRRRLLILNDNKFYAQFPVAIGKIETPSPLGSWKVAYKAANWGTGFGTRWLGLNVPWGIYGIHGTNKPFSIGTQASHGCFRMFNRDVETIYPYIKKGTPVIVIGNPFGPVFGGFNSQGIGSCNSQVLFMQEKLKRLGFYPGEPDGRFGGGTAKAVREMQKQFSLPVTGRVGQREYEALGIMMK